ncbi:MAG: UvrD-helicase domain-containing protein [Deltaproteobacteria bacterium]|nr:UvrD-helicase domain-containing protein [Deltaproteobacteria bacterium]
MSAATSGVALADQAARDRICRDLDTTLIVEAAAGTGKTTALVGRIVAALMAGRARLDRLVAVTFTELAAGELKLRLRTEIERARRSETIDGAARRCLTEALPQLEEARIGTIHSFCSELLRERPVEARVDPLFEVAPDDVAGDLFRRAFDRWFEECLAAPPPGVRRILRRRGRDGAGPRELLRAAAWALTEWRDFPTPWRRVAFSRDAAIDALMAEMEALGARAPEGDPEDYFTRSLAEIQRLARETRRRELVTGDRDYDGLEAELLAFHRAKHWRWTGFSRTQGAFPKAQLRARRDALAAELAAFVDGAGADLAPLLRDELWPVVERYDALKRRAGRLDFLDLLLIARDLLRQDATVRRDLQERFTHVFVDEFQDTDPLQAEILLLLAADDPAARDWTAVRPVPGKLFLVGDPKQSIYRFRRADVALYEEIKRRLVAGGAAVEHLTVSFRAVPEIQETVNAALALRMGDGSPSQAAYVPLVPTRAAAPQPAVVALPVPAPYGDYGTVVDWRIETSLPDAVAAFVDWLVRESGWTVTEREKPNERVPIVPRHVCLLFRRFRSFGRDVTRDYVRALEARHLPHVLVGGSSFHEREEVEAIRNALTAIERPDDDLAVFATVRGPLFALADGALLAFRDRFSSLHPFRALPEDLPAPLAEVAAALGVLRELHRGRNRRPIADTIARLLAATRAHAGLAIWPTGEQALANVTRLMDLARRAERSGVTSFRAFVERLADEADRGDASDAPILEEGTGGVRVMTVHRAKGLEFPVVVLADLTANETPNEPTRATDPARALCAMRLAGCSPPELLERREVEREREREEAARILYVATTRARDLLVVPVIGDERRDGWLGALAPVLYPAEARRRQPEARTVAACPAFGVDSVVERPDRAPGRERGVAPGLHRPEFGRHRVVWWDPHVLRLNVEESVGLRQQRLLEADDAGAVAEGGVRDHAGWQAERARVRTAAMVPTMAVATATAWAASAAASGVTLEEAGVECVGDAGARPHGTRFGSLVHAVLAAADLDSDAATIARLAALQARLLGASKDERDAAADAAVRALASPLLRRAAAAARIGGCRREVPVALRLDEGTLVEGVADLAFCEDGHWTVVDFKTDVELESRLGEYRLQLALYARAIAVATGTPASGVLLRV